MPGINDYLNIPVDTMNPFDIDSDTLSKVEEIVAKSKINLEVVIASRGGDAVPTTPQIR